MLGAELVYALREQAAVSFSDVMLRRLWHTQGPCLDEECLRRAHGVFVRERRWVGGEDPLRALTAVRDEVESLWGAAR
jgi:hypothetical protein